MRVTNAMLRNNMMLGLNKNMTKLDTLYNQMNSLKKIQRPSDDPIVLGRSLKLKLNVLETVQYQSNVGEARSWMEVSEKAMTNSVEILNDIRYQCVQGSNGPLTLEDRKKIMTTIEQLKKQLIQEANANYAGRNVFGGYKTDQKVLFDKDIKMEQPVQFEQTFTKDDVETVTYREEDYYRIRLPYGDVNDVVDPSAFITGLTDVAVEVVDSTDDPAEATPPVESYYYPGADTSTVPPTQKAYFLKDIGELIINKATYDAMNTDITISYEKTNFKEGDPNPELFFNAKSDGGTPPVYTYTTPKGSQKLEYEIGIGTKLDVNVLGKDIYNPYSLRDIDEVVYILGSYETIEEGINEGDRNHKETINLSKLFSNSIGDMDKALHALSTQQADLGSRMKRLEFTEKRLGDDKISFSELLSRTEDVDLEEIYVDFNTQYAVYQSALHATSRVVQPTLLDFLR